MSETPTAPQPDQPEQAPQPAQEPTPAPAKEPKAGDLVTFEVEDPYGDEGPTVRTHAGFVVQAAEGRVRVHDLGPVDRSADFPVDAVQLAD